MITNIEIDKKSNESNASMLRRFTKAVQGSGILPRVRSLRYSTRKLSHYKTKMQRLTKIERKTNIQELIKLGKMSERSENQKSR